MKIWLGLLLSIAAVVLIFFVNLNSQTESELESLTVSQTAPNFSLTDTHGTTHSLADFQGSYVVLEWINHGCPFVKKHYDSGNMQGLQQEMTNQDVVWLSICSSAPGKQGYFAAEAWNQMTTEKGAQPTAVLLDPDGYVGRQYGAKTTPHMFVIDPQGTLIYQGAIDDHPTADQADIAGAKNYVQAALLQALAGKPVLQPRTKSYGCSVKYGASL